MGALDESPPNCRRLSSEYIARHQEMIPSAKRATFLLLLRWLLLYMVISGRARRFAFTRLERFQCMQSTLHESTQLIVSRRLVGIDSILPLPSRLRIEHFDGQEHEQILAACDRSSAPFQRANGARHAVEQPP